MANDALNVELWRTHLRDVYAPPLEIWPSVARVWNDAERKEIHFDFDLDFFNQGIESAALHVEGMGLKLVAREIRDLKRKPDGAHE